LRKIGVGALAVTLALAACQESTVGPTATDSLQASISGVRGGLTAAAATVTRGFACNLSENGFNVSTTNSVSVQDSPTTSTLICSFVLPVEQRPVVAVTVRGVLCGTFTGLTSSSLVTASPNGLARLQCYDTT
jgi:hypothetical protein